MKKALQHHLQPYGCALQLNQIQIIQIKDRKNISKNITNILYLYTNWSILF